MVFVPSISIRPPTTLVQIFTRQLNTILTDWSIDWNTIDSDSKYGGGLSTHWHLNAGGVVVVVIFISWGRVSCTYIKLFKFLHIDASDTFRKPRKYQGPGSSYADMTDWLTSHWVIRRPHYGLRVDLQVCNFLFYIVRVIRNVRGEGPGVMRGDSICVDCLGTIFIIHSIHISLLPSVKVNVVWNTWLERSQLIRSQSLCTEHQRGK